MVFLYCEKILRKYFSNVTLFIHHRCGSSFRDFDYFVPFHRYVFELIAQQDHPLRPSLLSKAVVEIDLTNDNIRPPMFIDHSDTFYISETAPIGTKIGTIYAFDPDNDKIRYSTMSSQFSIDPNSGVLELKQPIQSTSPSSYSLSVTICDYSSSPIDSSCQNLRTKTILVLVTAVNKQSPRFMHPQCGQNLKLFEDASIGTVVATIEVFDDDRGENGNITIAFPSEESRTTRKFYSRIRLLLLIKKVYSFNIVNGFKNTAYSQFSLEQMEQKNSVRQATIRTNKKFDYDTPGRNSCTIHS